MLNLLKGNKLLYCKLCLTSRFLFLLPLVHLAAIRSAPLRTQDAPFLPLGRKKKKTRRKELLRKLVAHPRFPSCHRPF